MIYAMVPFRRWHLDWLGDTMADGNTYRLDLETARMLEKMGTCWTGVVDGDPIACGGIIPVWPGRSQAWILLNEKTGPHMFWITKRVAEALERTKGRIELTVRADFELGHRWARMLGFSVETPRMEAYGPQGEAHVGYVRFNGD